MKRQEDSKMEELGGGITMKIRWLLAGLILCGWLGMASVSPAAGGAWTKKADMPTPRAVFAAGVVDGVI